MCPRLSGARGGETQRGAGPAGLEGEHSGVRTAELCHLEPAQEDFAGSCRSAVWACAQARGPELSETVHLRQGVRGDRPQGRSTVAVHPRGSRRSAADTGLQACRGEAGGPSRQLSPQSSNMPSTRFPASLSDHAEPPSDLPAPKCCIPGHPGGS